MGAHMQTIGDERDRTEQHAADNFCDHHGTAEPDYGPRPALVLVVTLSEKTHGYGKPKERRCCSQSWRPSFQIGADDFEQLLRRFGV